MDFLEIIFPYLKQKHLHELKQKRVLRALIIFTFIIVLLFGIAIGIYISLDRIPIQSNPQWGVTFSKKYATELGLDWKQAHLAMLDDLKARTLRIPAYWDDIERARGHFDFTDLDWMLMEAQHRNATVMLVIGRRLPRWPECHDPLWTLGLSEKEISMAQLHYLETVVKRYRAHPALKNWQVENEPFLSTFGICPSLDRGVFEKEIDLVRRLSDKPIIVTESGELSFWTDAPQYADIVGISLYRVVWNQYIGYFYWPLPSSYYRKKAELVRHRVRDVIITEVQLEPWTSTPIITIPIQQQLKHFNLDRFRDTISYARKTGLNEIYLWGAEWWYWMKLQGHPEYWEEARKVFNPI